MFRATLVTFGYAASPVLFHRPSERIQLEDCLVRYGACHAPLRDQPSDQESHSRSWLNAQSVARDRPPLTTTIPAGNGRSIGYLRRIMTSGPNADRFLPLPAERAALWSSFGRR